MAQTSTIYNFNVTLSHVDRGIYEDLKLQLARHPSETMAYLLTRLFAYCLEFEEGISFSKGLSEAEEPAVWVHDLTGQLTACIEVGSPSAIRLHRASKLGARVVVYTHKDAALLASQLAGEQIFEASKIRLLGFSQNFMDALSQAIEKRTTLAISVSEGQLYVTVADKNFESALTLYPIVAKQ